MDTAIAKRRTRALGRKAIERIQSGLAMLILSAGAVVILIPLAWMISTSLKSDVELFKNPGFIPWDWKWDNFSHAWNSVPFNTFFKNSVIITVLAVIGTLISNSLVAYGFARLNFKGKKWFFGILLGTMMIPGSVLMIPSYILYSRLGWVNTFLPLIVPNFFSSAFYVFLLRQFMVGIPKDYSEAAHIEGANELTIYARIILPLSKPALISIAIFEFTAKWNDFMGPLLYLNSEKKYTLQLGLRMFQSATGFEWQLFMAASIIVLLPTVIVFFVLQRYFIEGLAMSGMKN